jgi:hypothetical protein
MKSRLSIAFLLILGLVVAGFAFSRNAVAEPAKGETCCAGQAACCTEKAEDRPECCVLQLDCCEEQAECCVAAECCVDGSCCVNGESCDESGCCVDNSCCVDGACCKDRECGGAGECCCQAHVASCDRHGCSLIAI